MENQKKTKAKQSRKKKKEENERNKKRTSLFFFQFLPSSLLYSTKIKSKKKGEREYVYEFKKLNFITNKKKKGKNKTTKKR